MEEVSIQYDFELMKHFIHSFILAISITPLRVITFCDDNKRNADSSSTAAAAGIHPRLLFPLFICDIFPVSYLFTLSFLNSSFSCSSSSPIRFPSILLNLPLHSPAILPAFIHVQHVNQMKTSFSLFVRFMQQ